MKSSSKKIVILGTLIIWAIKFVLRPLQLFDDPARFVLNISPNLIGAFLIPFGAYWFFSGRNYFIARLFRIQTGYDLRLVCLLGFLLLVINEYLQKLPIFGRTFDLNDIVFSSVGLAISFIVFGRLQQKHAASLEPQRS